MRKLIPPTQVIRLRPVALRSVLEFLPDSGKDRPMLGELMKGLPLPELSPTTGPEVRVADLAIDRSISGSDPETPWFAGPLRNIHYTGSDGLCVSYRKLFDYWQTFFEFVVQVGAKLDRPFADVLKEPVLDMPLLKEILLPALVRERERTLEGDPSLGYRSADQDESVAKGSGRVELVPTLGLPFGIDVAEPFRATVMSRVYEAVWIRVSDPVSQKSRESRQRQSVGIAAFVHDIFRGANLVDDGVAFHPSATPLITVSWAVGPERSAPIGWPIPDYETVFEYELHMQYLRDVIPERRDVPATMTVERISDFLAAWLAIAAGILLAIGHSWASLGRSQASRRIEAMTTRGSPNALQRA